MGGTTKAWSRGLGFQHQYPSTRGDRCGGWGRGRRKKITLTHGARDFLSLFGFGFGSLLSFLLRFLHLCVWSGAGLGAIIFSPLLCFMDRKEYIS